MNVSEKSAIPDISSVSRLEARRVSLSMSLLFLMSCLAAPVHSQTKESSPSLEKETQEEIREETWLPDVTVRGQIERDSTTEGTGSYTAGTTTTTTRFPLTLRETPQSITVITRQQMDDFGLNTVTDALRNLSGVNGTKLGVGTGFFSRGFELQGQYDGMAMPGTFGVVGNSAPDSAFLDHLEILQGAAGLLTGAGEPGGIINLVRKRPTENFQARVEAELGS